ncbi:alpha/beta fold hydrolase [Microvirga rosea]|uniref:alpha/beta fold hydrolase n=1 Tax=Microvirga rosea TaxID=2715425 RepID=UPI001D0BB5E0|nr:alpha/beta hydrolase [Microvirga rosea]MCB8820629.1 alpha/beta hydrolase [Microvirga rosea]
MNLQSAARSGPAPLQQTIGQDRFPYVDMGNGVPVVFLHGALADWRIWAEHCRLLSKRFRCISFTQRYFGETAWREDGPRFGVSTHAEDLIAFVEALGIGPVNLVAWSYAGHVALHAATQRPELFSRILAYEPGVRTLPLGPDEAALVGQDAQAAFGPIFAAVGEGRLEDAVRLLIDASGGAGHFDAEPADSRRIKLENLHTMPLLLSQEEPPAMSCEDLKRLPVPVSVAWGEKTRPLFKFPSEAVARCVAHGAHREVPGVGHLWPDEDPPGFSAFVESWLDEKP